MVQSRLRSLKSFESVFSPSLLLQLICHTKSGIWSFFLLHANNILIERGSSRVVGVTEKVELRENKWLSY